MRRDKHYEEFFTRHADELDLRKLKTILRLLQIEEDVGEANKLSLREFAILRDLAYVFSILEDEEKLSIHYTCFKVWQIVENKISFSEDPSLEPYFRRLTEMIVNNCPLEMNEDEINKDEKNQEPSRPKPR